MITRQAIIEAARMFGVQPNGSPAPDRATLGNAAMIAPMEWGYWVAGVYVSREDVQRVATAIALREDLQGKPRTGLMAM